MGQVDLAQAALMIANDDNFAAHTRDISQHLEWGLYPGDFKAGICPFAFRQLFHTFRQILPGNVHNMAGT